LEKGSKIRRILNMDEPHVRSEPIVQAKNNIISKHRLISCVGRKVHVQIPLSEGAQLKSREC
jgi:hypothetical protein